MDTPTTVASFAAALFVVFLVALISKTSFVGVVGVVAVVVGLWMTFVYLSKKCLQSCLGKIKFTMEESRGG